MSQDPYLIKRYDNRRLYDTQQKRFLNLKDLRGLIRDGHRLRVEDSRGRDITRQILLQIIVESEDGEHPLLSDDLLHTLARAYGDVMQSVFGRYLDESVKTFLQQQATWRNALETSIEEGPMSAFSRIAEAQLQMWSNAQDTFSALLGGPPAKPSSKRRGNRK